MVLKTIIQETVTLWDAVLYTIGGCLGTDKKPPRHRRHEHDSDFDSGPRKRRESDTRKHSEGKIDGRVQPLDFDGRPISTRLPSDAKSHNGRYLVIDNDRRASHGSGSDGRRRSDERRCGLKYLEESDETPGGYRRQHYSDQRQETLAPTGESTERRAAKKHRMRESRAANGNGEWMGE